MNFRRKDLILSFVSSQPEHGEDFSFAADAKYTHKITKKVSKRFKKLPRLSKGKADIACKANNPRFIIYDLDNPDKIKEIRINDFSDSSSDVDDSAIEAMH